MSENMEVVTFTASTIFDRKVRKLGDTVTVSEGEAENLRRIGVVAEKGADTETVTINVDVDVLDQTKLVEELASGIDEVISETGKPEDGHVHDGVDSKQLPGTGENTESEMPAALPAEEPEKKRKYKKRK